MLPPPRPPLPVQSVAPGAVPQGLTPAAWQSISDQIAAGPYRTYPTNSGYASANPAHGWQIGYGTDGATHLTPRDATAPAWQWGLRLASYTVSVSGMTGAGTVTAAIPAGAAQGAAGNLSLAATSTDNSVTFAPTPSVTHYAVYLPLVFTAPPQPTVVVLRDTPFPVRAAQQREVFWQRTLSIPTLASGTYVLAASADGTLPALVDDEIHLLVNGQVLFSYDFSASGHLVAAIVPLPAAVLAQIQGQTVTVELVDRYGVQVEATPLYLVQRP